MLPNGGSDSVHDAEPIKNHRLLGGFLFHLGRDFGTEV